MAYSTFHFLLIITSYLIIQTKCQDDLKRQPNIIIIVADDLGWGDVSFHGSTRVKTPDIDALASDGIVLNNYYVQPICTPSRGSIMSGRHPIHTGLQYSVIQGETPYGLPLNFKIIPEYMKRLNYTTHAVGKWHIGHHTRKHLPNSRGFDSFFGYLIGAEDYYDHTSVQSFGWGMDLRRNFEGVAEKYFGVYSTQMYTDEAVKIIQNHNESLTGPMFLYLAYQAIHVGNGNSLFQVPKEYEARFTDVNNPYRRKILAMTNALNEGIARVFQTLKDSDMLNNTIIVFTADNGGATGSLNGPRIDGSFGSNWPLRGTKFTLWEGGIRGNAFIWSPLLKKSSFTYDGLFHITDWLPTLYVAAGGDKRDLPHDLFGLNLWPSLNGMNGGNRVELLHNIDDVQSVSAVRLHDYKLVSGTIRDGNYDGWYEPPDEKNMTRDEIRSEYEKSIEKSRVAKLLRGMNRLQKNPDLPIMIECKKEKKICDLKSNKYCLFKISEDPCEFNNVIDNYPDVAKLLKGKLDSYNRTAVPPGNTPLDPNSLPALHGYYWGPWLES